MRPLQAVRGMNDILPPQTQYWAFLEKKLAILAASYGYQEIRFPIVEQTALFKRSIGEATDIVEKEMYTFADRNDLQLTLRPEGTAGCMRAGIESGLFYNQIQRLWYIGPMFRHERPQKGRYRQFHQFGIEACGIASSDVDAEIIYMSARIWKMLGLEQIELHINSLGSAQSRAIYKEQLVAYFSDRMDQLDEDSRRRLHINPLRILDSKNPALQSLIQGAPILTDYLDDFSATAFKQLCAHLDKANIPYIVNPRLVRGLDYYNGVVFEWITDQLGAQNAVCSGGRYDILAELLGGKPTPAIGFAVGLERLIELLQINTQLNNQLDAYLIMLGESAQAEGLLWAERWRDAAPNLRLLANCGGGNFKTQLKRADKSGAKFAIILGEDELKAKKATIKYLREECPQESISFSELAAFFMRLPPILLKTSNGE